MALELLVLKRLAVAIKPYDRVLMSAKLDWQALLETNPELGRTTGSLLFDTLRDAYHPRVCKQCSDLYVDPLVTFPCPESPPVTVADRDRANI